MSTREMLREKVSVAAATVLEGILKENPQFLNVGILKSASESRFSCPILSPSLSQSLKCNEIRIDKIIISLLQILISRSRTHCWSNFDSPLEITQFPHRTSNDHLARWRRYCSHSSNNSGSCPRIRLKPV